MKTLRKLWIAGMTLALLACGKTEAPAEEPAAEGSAAAVQQEESAAASNVVESSYGKAEGILGNTMRATNLEFTLNSAELTASYQTLTPDAGMSLLVLNITTHVLQSAEMKLYDTDYQVQWGGTGEEDYSVPVTYRDEWATAPTYKRNVNLDGIEGMFPGEMTLQPDETITTDYVYQVPEGTSAFTLQFQEFFADESLGDRYIVSFTAQQQ